jgi:exosortase F-associated protein
MLKNMFKNSLQILILFLLVILLVSVRLFENHLFYDPFLAFFKNSPSTNNLPVADNFKLFFGLFLRYFLNTILSLSIIYVIFNDRNLIKFTSVLYTLFFIVLIISFFTIYQYFGNDNKMTLFYIRRFLIQPIFLLLFVPAFYFQKKIVKSEV